MIFIAHRGNIFGPKKELENSPNYINQALHAGFHVEVDVWYVFGEFRLGHDGPIHHVNQEFLENDKLWCHAKSISTLEKILPNKNIHCFFHDIDECTLTSRGFIWTYPGKSLTKQSIAVMPERVKEEYKLDNVYGVCSDYVLDYSYDLNFKPNLILGI